MKRLDVRSLFNCRACCVVGRRWFLALRLSALVFSTLCAVSVHVKKYKADLVCDKARNKQEFEIGWTTFFCVADSRHVQGGGRDSILREQSYPVMAVLCRHERRSSVCEGRSRLVWEHPGSLQWSKEHLEWGWRHAGLRKGRSPTRGGSFCSEE